LVQDTSERKRAERALLEREAHFRSLFEAGTDGIVLINRERRTTDVNPGFERLLGYSAGELIGAGIGDYFSPNAEPPDPTKVDVVLRGELASYEHETLFTRKDGSEVWALGVVSPVRDAAGNVQFGMVTLLDITLRKRAEEELRASEAQFRSLFEDAPTAIAMMDTESGFFAGNPAWESMFGYSAAEMKDYRSTDFLSPNHARQSAGQLDRLLKGELPFIEGEWLYRRKDGSDVWASGRVSAVSDTTGGTSYVLFMLQDITERKLAEQELQESQSRFVATIEQAPVGIAIVGLDRMILQVNPLFCELFGQEAEDLVGQGFRSYFAPATTGQGVDAWSQLLAGQIDSYVQERTLIDPPPGVEWLSISISMVRDDRGAALFAVRIASDVTERKRAEQELRDNAERLRAVFESGPFGLAIIDADTRVLDVNGWLPSMFGYTREEMIGKRMEEFVDPAHVRRSTRDSRRLVSGEQDRLTTDRIYQRKDGSKFPAIVSTSAVRDEQGTYRYSVRAIQDITERVSAETTGRDSEARFRSLFEAAPQGIVLKDANDLIVEVNHALEVFLGRAGEDLRGHRVRDYVSPSDYPRNDHDYARLVTGEISTIEIERVFIRPDGSEVWGAISQSAVRDSSGAFAFGVMTIEDVTVRHRQEQEISDPEAWFRAVFESGPLGLALIDAKRVSRK
jgi:PAS domain S-box-containing protein